MEINVKEFVRNTSKWLKVATEEGLVVTNRGEPTYKIGKYTEEDVATKPKVATKSRDIVATYGCGCKKGDNALCTKHGRY